MIIIIINLLTQPKWTPKAVCAVCCVLCAVRCRTAALRPVSFHQARLARGAVRVHTASRTHTNQKQKQNKPPRWTHKAE